MPLPRHFVHEHWLGDSDNQQSRLDRIWGLLSRMPATTTAFIVGSAGLVGCCRWEAFILQLGVADFGLSNLIWSFAISQWIDSL